jgi:arsenate reductase
MNEKIKILFLCTGNSCRSQMAEGWTRALKGDEVDVFSAGIETHGLNPHAVAVMAEAGVDISGQTSQLWEEFLEVSFDWVITVCGHAHESCPVLPAGVRVKHVGFEDPPKLARGMAEQGASEEEQLKPYRRVRDEIRDFVETIPGSLEPPVRELGSLDMPDCSQCSGCG